jgi:hypothetical protein
MIIIFKLQAWVINILMHFDNNSYTNSCGLLKNFFPIDQLQKIVTTFNRVNPVDGEGNNCFGIDQKHLAYPWLRVSLLRPISEQFNPNLKLIFAMFLDCVKPFSIHHDIKEIPEDNGRHFLSFLIPYSVDNDISKCQHASTLIFNETETLIFNQTNEDLNDMLTRRVDNNFSSFHEEKISHVPKETTYSVSLKKELVWSAGDLLWWDSQLLHVSNNFLKNGCTSKQGIVIHTYVL